MHVNKVLHLATVFHPGVKLAVVLIWCHLDIKCSGYGVLLQPGTGSTSISVKEVEIRLQTGAARKELQ